MSRQSSPKKTELEESSNSDISEENPNDLKLAFFESMEIGKRKQENRKKLLLKKTSKLSFLKSCNCLKSFYDEIKKLMFDKYYKFMISQNDPRKTNWELFVIVLALYNSFSIPFELCF